MRGGQRLPKHPRCRPGLTGEVKRRSSAPARGALHSLLSGDGTAAGLGPAREAPRYGPLTYLDLAHLAADASAARERAQAASVAQSRAEAGRTKRHEVAGLNKQIQSLTTTVDRLSRAVDEVAGFKREPSNSWAIEGI